MAGEQRLFRATLLHTTVVSLLIACWTLPALAANPPWWDRNYRIRRAVTVTNNALERIDPQYSLLAQLDHASLVTQGRSKPDGEDVRVVYKIPGITTAAQASTCTSAGGQMVTEDSVTYACYKELSRLPDPESVSVQNSNTAFALESIRGLWHFNDTNTDGSSTKVGTHLDPIADFNPIVGQTKPLGLYYFDGPCVTGGVRDEIDSQCKGTFSGALVTTPFLNGKIGSSSLNLPGNVSGSSGGLDNLVIPYSQVPLEPGSALTVEAWINVTNFNGDGRLIAKSNSYDLRTGNSPNAVDNTGFFSIQAASNNYRVIGNLILIPGRWHHLVGTYEVTGTLTGLMKIYVDGQLRGSQVVTVLAGKSPSIDYGSTPSNIPLTLGTLSSTSKSIFGRMDELAIYDRALPADEILRHYLRGIGADESVYRHVADIVAVKSATAETVQVSPTSPVQTFYPLVLDGVKNYVRIEDRSDSTGIGSLNPPVYTVEGWFKPAARPSTGQLATLMSKKDPGAAGAGWLLQLDSAGHIKFSGWAGSVASGTPVSVTTTSSIPNGSWSHVAGVFGNGHLQVYINGVLAPGGDITLPNPNTPDPSTAPLLLGADMFVTAGVLGDFFQGSMDEVAFYATPLTASEVNSHYQFGVPKLGFNVAATSLRFPAQATLNGCAPPSPCPNDSSYFLYYGNPSPATSAPKDPKQVYRFYDELSAQDTSSWTYTNPGGAAQGWVNDIRYLAEPNPTAMPSFNDITTAAFPNATSGARVVVDFLAGINPNTLGANFWVGLTDPTFTKLVGMGVVSGLSSSYRFTSATNRTVTGDRIQSPLASAPTTDGQNFHLHRLILDPGAGTSTVPNDYFLIDDLLKYRYSPGANNVLVPNVPLSFAINMSQTGSRMYYFDWVKIRDYVNPEPNTVLAAEERQSPTMASSSNSVYVVGSGSQPIPSITISDPAGYITAAAGIYLKIPAGLNVTWNVNVCPATTPATFAGTAAGNVNANVCATDATKKTLKVTVTSDFPANSTLTLSGINFLVSSTSASGAQSLQLDVANDGVIEATDSKTIKVKEAFSVDSSGGIQVGDAFQSAAAFTNLSVFKTKLTATGGTANLTGLKFHYSGLTPSGSVTLLGTGLVPDPTAPAAGGVINFAFPAVAIDSTGKTLTVQASFGTVNPADKFTIWLDTTVPADITASGVTSGDLMSAAPNSISFVGALTLYSVTHERLGYSITAPVGGSIVEVRDAAGNPITLHMAWSQVGTAAKFPIPDNADVFLSTTAVPAFTTKLNTAGPQVASFDWTVDPTKVTTHARIEAVSTTNAQIFGAMGSDFTIREHLAVGDPGQSNGFTGIVSGVPLLNFSLTPTGGTGVKLQKLILGFSVLNGMVPSAGGMNNPVLKQGGVAVGTPGTVDLVAKTITFDFTASPVTVSAMTNYVVTADFSSINGADAMKVSLDPAKIIAKGATTNVQLDAPVGGITGGVISNTNERLTYNVTPPNSGDTWNVSTTQSISWTEVGTAAKFPSPDKVNVLISINGQPYDPTPIATGTTGTPATWAVSPAKVSGTVKVEVVSQTQPTIFGESSVFAIREHLDVGNRALSNQFSGALTGVQILKFSLTPTPLGGSGVQVQSLTVDLSAVSAGIATDGMKNAVLSVEGGGAVGGPGTISLAGATGTITFNTPFTLTAATNYVIAVDFTQMGSGDTMTASLSAAKITAKGLTSGKQLDTPVGGISGAAGPVTHNRSGYTISAPAAGDSIPVNSTKTIRWTPNGTATNPVKLEYSISVDPVTAVSNNYQSINLNFTPTDPVNPSFDWLVPVGAISGQAKIRITQVSDSTVAGYSGGTAAGNFFSITGDITITSPPAKDLRYTDTLPRWPVNVSPIAQTISWTPTGTMSPFQIKINGVPVGAPVAGTSTTFTPTVPSASATVTVADATTGHPPFEKSTQVAFSTVSVNQPNGTVAWSVGTAQFITWSQTGLETVDILYSIDGGKTYTLINQAGPVKASDQQFNWTSIDSGARGPKTHILIRDAINKNVSDTDPTTGAFAKSANVKIVGKISAVTPTKNPAVGVPTAPEASVQWTNPGTPAQLVPFVALYLVDDVSSAVTPIPGASRVPNSGAGGSFSWTPSATLQQARYRVCDADFPDPNDADACSTTPTSFSIGGIHVSAPATATYLVGQGPVEIDWDQVGVVGSVNIWFSPTGAAPWTTVATGVATGATGKFTTWVIPDSISDMGSGPNPARIKVEDASDPTRFGLSPAFTITGALAVQSPAAGTAYYVRDTIPIRWTTTGTIPTVSLLYSTDGSTPSIPVPGGTSIANTNQFDWVLPDTVITNQLKVRVVDATSGHPATFVDFGPFISGARLTLDPLAGNRWAVNEVHTVSWKVIGSGVGRVLIEFATETDGYTTWKPVGTFANSGATGSANWQVPDIVPYPNGDPTKNIPAKRDVNVKLRISNPDTSLVPAAISPDIFQVIYYIITWHVQDADTNSLLFALSVNDSSGWQVFDNSLVSPGIGLGDPRGTTRAYPFGTFTTSFSKVGYTDSTVGNWTADSDKVMIARMESEVAAQIPWEVKSSYEYEDAVKKVHITTYLQRREQLVNPALLGDAKVTLVDGNGAIVTTLASPAPDASGVYRMDWDASSATPNVTYFGKASITYNGTLYSSGGTFNLLIPLKIQQLSVTSGGGSSGPDVSADVAAIKAATVGPTSALTAVQNAVTTTLPQQLTNAQNAIQTSVATAQTALSSQITGVSNQVTDVKNDTAQIGTTVIPAINGVKTYLEDPNAGLPKVLANQTAMQNQLKAQRRGGILNRSMQIEQGDTATIRYRSVDDTVQPTINVIDPLGGTVTLPMTHVGQYLFEFPLAGAQLGEYRVTVNEPASTDSAGTLDSAVVTVRTAVATTTSITNLQSALTAIGDKLDNEVIPRLKTIVTTTDNINTLATNLGNDTRALLAKWGILSAQDLQTQLSDLYTRIGAPASGVSIAQDLANINTAMAKDATVAKSAELAGLAKTSDLANLATKTDLAPLATKSDLATVAQKSDLATLAEKSDLANLATKSDLAPLAKTTDLTTLAQKSDLATLAQDASVKAIDTKLGTPTTGTIAGDIAAIPGAIDYTTRFNTIDKALSDLQTLVSNLSGGGGGGGSLATIQASVDAVKAAVGTPAAGTTVSQDLDQIKTNMAKTSDLAPLATKSDLATVAQKSDLAALAQKSDLATLADKSDLANLAAKTDLAPLATKSDLATVAQKSDLATVAQKSDLATVAQKSDLAGLAQDATVKAVDTKLGTPKTSSIVGDIAAIPGATDYTPQFTTIQNNLNALSKVVNDPAQAGKLQEALDALTAMKAQIAALPTTPSNSQAVTDALNALNTAVNDLKTDVAALPKTDQTAALTGLKTDLSSLSGSVAAIPSTTSQAENAGTATLLSKLDELKKSVESAQGSSAAVGFAQSAYSAASESLKILQQLQTELRTNGAGSPNGPVLLDQLGNQLKSISSSVTVIPPQMNHDDELKAQLKKLAAQARAVSSDKGYHFDSLYEISEEQASDVKTMRNRVEELKQLLEVQRSILEKNVNQPVVKTWFEAR